MGSGAAEDEASEPEAAGAEAEPTETLAQYILLIELHHIKIFSTQIWTICHLLFPFFLTGVQVFFTYQPADPDLFLLLFLEGGVGGWRFGFLSSEHHTTGSV